jgi:hypothetical protein
MSKNWNELREGAGRVIEKISTEAVRLGDVASMKLRLEACRGRLNKEYALLGKLTYAKLKNSNDNTDCHQQPESDAKTLPVTQRRYDDQDRQKDQKASGNSNQHDHGICRINHECDSQKQEQYRCK